MLIFPWFFDGSGLLTLQRRGDSKAILRGWKGNFGSLGGHPGGLEGQVWGLEGHLGQGFGCILGLVVVILQILRVMLGLRDQTRAKIGSKSGESCKMLVFPWLFDGSGLLTWQWKEDSKTILRGWKGHVGSLGSHPGGL